MQASTDLLTLDVDELHFAVRRSERRRTMQITVERDGDLTVAAPPEVAVATLRAFIREKKFWIYTKLAEKERLQRHIPRKEFVHGEGFLYLGRSYRLKIIDEQEAPLRLSGGRFCLRRDAVDAARTHFIAWYSAHADQWLSRRALKYRDRMAVGPATVSVRDLGYRWGSCGKSDRLYFHWKTILLPAPVAEYVMVHELAHLKERHHTPQFWLAVERAMPDYEARKSWLAEHGTHVEGI
jgi:predicted metal-dependent hydrolase